MADIRQLFLVHGLWLRAWSLGLMKRQFMEQGFRVRRFDYATSRGDFDRSADELARLLQRFGTQPVGIVAHSLGGLLTLAALNRLGKGEGRAVLMGSPLRGSRVARRLRHWPGGDYLLGGAAEILDRGSVEAPPQGWQIGMIAGDRSVGAGLLLGGTGAPGDGTVSLQETQADFLTDRLVMRETHTSMLGSPRVSRAAAVFLRLGRFGAAQATGTHIETSGQKPGH